MRVVDTLPLGTAPHGVVISPDDKTVYVTNIVSNDISIIDTASYTEKARVLVGKEPNGITYWKR